MPGEKWHTVISYGLVKRFKDGQYAGAEVRALLLSLTGNTELAVSGEFVFASNPRKSRDTLINSL